MIVPFGDVGKQAGGAILHAVLRHSVVAAAFIKEIERTETEQAVELIRLPGLMTRKVFAITIAEKTVAVVHGYLNDTCFTGGSHSLSSGNFTNGKT